jgi:hypothetical protein
MEPSALPFVTSLSETQESKLTQIEPTANHLSVRRALVERWKARQVQSTVAEARCLPTPEVDAMFQITARKHRLQYLHSEVCRSIGELEGRLCSTNEAIAGLSVEIAAAEAGVGVECGSAKDVQTKVGGLAEQLLPLLHRSGQLITDGVETVADECGGGEREFLEGYLRPEERLFLPSEEVSLKAGRLKGLEAEATSLVRQIESLSRRRGVLERELRDSEADLAKEQGEFVMRQIRSDVIKAAVEWAFAVPGGAQV